MKIRTALVTCYLAIALVIAACAVDAITPPPTPTLVPVVSGGPLPTRAASILEEISTPIPLFTPAPPSAWIGLASWSLPSVAPDEKIAAALVAEPTSVPTAEPTVETVAEATSAPADTPTAEVTFTPVVDLTAVPVVEATAEPVAEATTAPVVEDAVEAAAAETPLSPLAAQIAAAVSQQRTLSETLPSVDAATPVAPEEAQPATEPTATSVEEPTVAPEPTATAEPTVAPEPTTTETPVPTPTPTDQPTTTPVPTATDQKVIVSFFVRPQPQTTSTATPTPVQEPSPATPAATVVSPAAAPAPAPLPLLLLSSAPADGAAWRGEPVVFTFDSPLDPASVNGLIVEPEVKGVAAVEGANLIFTPEEAPPPDTRYRFTLGEAIVADVGQPLTGEVTVDLVSPAPFLVTSTQPSDGSEEVAASAPIVVIFNQPVVPLSGLDEQAGLPSPLTIEPAVAGSGAWINTSIYRFQPEKGLAGSTRYTVRVAGVVSLEGDALATDPTEFTFQTTAPVVVSSTPEGMEIAPDTTLTVQFSQPMDQPSAEAAFRLLHPSSGGASLPGVFDWAETGDSFTFTPAAPLAFGERYTILVTTDAVAFSGQGNLRQEWRSGFTVVRLPGLAGSDPQSGRTGVSPERGATIRFTGHLSMTTVLENVTISPPITSTAVYSYFSPYSNELYLNWAMEPRTTYTVTLGAAIADIYGNSLGEDVAVTFTTGDRAPLVQLNAPRFTHFSAYTDSRISLFYRNMPSLDAALYRLPESEILRLLGQYQWEAWRNYQHPTPAADLIWQRTITNSAEINELGMEVILLADESGQRLPTGAYLLQVALPPSSDPEAERYAQAMIVLSNDNLLLKKASQGESLVWQTDLASGVGVAEQPVRFLVEGSEVGRSVTDADGVAAARLTLDSQEPWLPVVAISGQPGDEHFALTSTYWEDGIAAWQWGLGTNQTPDEVRTAFYTERPIYRPGQTVYWKGIVRMVQDDAYRLPPAGMPVWVTIRDDWGNVLLDREFSVNEYGTVNGALALAETAVTGYYGMEVRIPLGGQPQTDGSGERFAYGGTSFQVAEYRAPEFEISLASAQPAYTQGETVEIAVEARYFSGGPLADAPVTWRLLAEPYFHTWTDAPADHYYIFDPVELADQSSNPFGGFSGGLVQEGQGVTDSAGRLRIQLPADLTQASRSQNWTFDVTVQSPTNQWVSGRTSVPVHRSELYIGVSPRGYVGVAGAPLAFDLVSLTPQNNPIPETSVDVVVYDYRWNSVYTQAANGSYYWETSVDKSPVYTGTLTTDAVGVGEFEWTPESGGQFLIALSGQDAEGNPTSSGVFVWVSSGVDGFVAWPRDNNDRVELVADKKGYAPGDTAKVLIPSPFTGPVYALITLERGGIIEHSVRTLVGNSETLEIPIRSEHIPNIYVSVVMVKGVDETNPIPSMRVGYLLLPVDAAERELSIQLDSSAVQARPGETVTYTVTVADSTGAPLPGVELSAALVDKAVLSLAAGDYRPLLDQFYYQLPLGVSMGALLTINQDRINQQLSEGGKGGGGGPGDALSLRQNFADLALWRAALVTDEDGRASFTVTLPDNLTTWRLAVRGASAQTQVGDAFHDITASKELLLRPILPRFFTAGDRVRVGVLAQNTMSEPLGAVTLRAEISGATFIGGNEPLSGPLGVGGELALYRVIEIGQEAESVEITFTGAADGFTDGVKMTLPVRRYETPEVVGTSGVVPASGRLEAVRVPAAATESGDLHVVIEPSLAAGMLDGLDFLKHFPYECVEQTVSRFLPNLVTALALQRLNVENPALQAELDEQLSIGLQKLINWQNPDGGWGWWSNMVSDPFVTTYVLWSLWTARDAGYSVPDNTLADAIFFLEQNWQAPAQTEAVSRLNQIAFAHFVLAEMGEGDPGRMSTLFDARERMDIYGQALLAVALDKVGDSRVQTLLDDIAGRANLSASGAHWQERSTDWWSMNTDLRTTAVVLHAFTRLRPADPLLPQAVRWLMVGRQSGRWSTTQENAWAIIALTSWMEQSGELTGAYDWQVTLNGETFGAGTVDGSNVSEAVALQTQVADLLRNEANALGFARSNESGQMYYSMDLRYALDATAISARDRGLVVSRRILSADGQPASSAAVGDVLSVTVSLNVPVDAHYLMVEVPIPAGVEIIDPRLATTSNQYGDAAFGPGGMDPWQEFWWRYWSPTHTDIRDDKAALFADFLAAGSYDYTFQVRAAIPGEYRVLPAHAELMYFPDVWGRSSGALFTVVD